MSRKINRLLCLLVGIFCSGPLSAQWGDFSSISENIKARNGIITELRIDWSGPERQLIARLDGTMTLFDDRPAIRTISPGGQFYLEERQNALYRKVTVRALPNGELSYEYEVQARPAHFSEIARDWFAQRLLEIVREAGINSRQRTAVLYKKAGESGILEEIAQIHRERSRRFYYERLLEFPAVSDSALYAVAVQVRANFLTDANLRIVLSGMVRRHRLSERTFLAVLEAIREINNEVTRANLLTEIATILPPSNARLRAAYREIAGTIQSAVERERVLSASK